MDFQQIGLLLLALFLVALNGFFVAAEFAIVKVRATRIKELAEKGGIAAKTALKTVTHLDAYLSATQLGITLASLALGWVGEPALGHLLEPLFARFGGISPAVSKTISITIAFAIITFLHIVFGELAPKSLAIQRSEFTTLAVAIPLNIFYKLFYPAIWVLTAVANFILRACGLPPASESELAHSPEELGMIISASQEGGLIEETPAYIADHALELGEIRAREVMTPRRDIVYLSTKNTLEENLEIARTHRFTRFLLCDGDIDDVIGRVHVREVLMLAQQPDVSLRDLCDPVLIIPENKPLDTLLHEFKAKRIYMAVVRDEYGGTAGLVTLEDVIEELVGEIQDELDYGAPEVVALPDGALDVDGRVSLGRLVRDYEAVAEVSDIETIGGYVLSTHDGPPQIGYETELNGWHIAVTEVEGPSITRLHLTPPPRKDADEPAR